MVTFWGNYEGISQDSASEVDGFLNKLNITDYKYYDFSQIYSCSDRTLNDYAVIFYQGCTERQ